MHGIFSKPVTWKLSLASLLAKTPRLRCSFNIIKVSKNLNKNEKFFFLAENSLVEI